MLGGEDLVRAGWGADGEEGVEGPGVVGGDDAVGGLEGGGGGEGHCGCGGGVCVVLMGWCCKRVEWGIVTGG